MGKLFSKLAVASALSILAFGPAAFAQAPGAPGTAGVEPNSATAGSAMTGNTSTSTAPSTTGGSVSGDGTGVNTTPGNTAVNPDVNASNSNPMAVPPANVARAGQPGPHNPTGQDVSH
jgi:hypothetical protein